MHSEGLDDFCRTFKIFTVIGSIPGVESTGSEDQCSAILVVNTRILNNGPSENLEGNLKVRLKWGVGNCQKVKLMKRGWSLGHCRRNYYTWWLQNVSEINLILIPTKYYNELSYVSFKTFPLCNCTILPGPVKVLITFVELFLK
jgi:hypothetical protein